MTQQAAGGIQGQHIYCIPSERVTIL